MIVKKIILLLFLLPIIKQLYSIFCDGWSKFNICSYWKCFSSYTSLTSSLAINKVKNDYINNLNAENICPTHHSSELNQIFFETIEHMDCYYDPMSILR